MRNRPEKSKKTPTGNMPANIKGKATRRIALVNLPKWPESKHGKLFNIVLELVKKYGDVASYEEEIGFDEGDAGFYLPLDKRGKYVYGCAFVQYEASSAAAKALVQLQGVKIGNNQVTVLSGDSKSLLKQCLRCSIAQAATYLDIVDGDISKAAEEIIRGDVHVDVEESTAKKAPPAAVPTATVFVPKEVPPKHKVPAPTPKESPPKQKITPVPTPTPKALATSADDRRFYSIYGDRIDGFINAVCGKATKKDLRDIISAVDAVLTADIGSDGEIIPSDLVNRPSFHHNIDEGRTPLSYAVAMNKKQRVHDLIDLGADVSKPMASQTKMETALTIAATNTKRDGTEMVRILLSKGANPTELSDAGVDEKALGVGMRYWLDKARRVGVPNKEDITHFKKTPPMDRLYELDYAVVGEEAAVHEIQDALASRFGNAAGQSITGKPLVMLLLGPPGESYMKRLL